MSVRRHYDFHPDDDEATGRLEIRDYGPLGDDDARIVLRAVGRVEQETATEDVIELVLSPNDVDELLGILQRVRRGDTQ